MAQDGNPRRGSLVFPIILITVGALFLFRNWHPGFDPVPILWTYWPLILIFIGVGKSQRPSGSFHRRHYWYDRVCPCPGRASLAWTKLFPPPRLQFGIAAQHANRGSTGSKVGARPAGNGCGTTHHQRRRESYSRCGFYLQRFLRPASRRLPR